MGVQEGQRWVAGWPLPFRFSNLHFCGVASDSQTGAEVRHLARCWPGGHEALHCEEPCLLWVSGEAPYRRGAPAGLRAAEGAFAGGMRHSSQTCSQEGPSPSLEPKAGAKGSPEAGAAGSGRTAGPRVTTA